MDLFGLLLPIKEKYMFLQNERYNELNKIRDYQTKNFLKVDKTVLLKE